MRVFISERYISKRSTTSHWCLENILRSKLLKERAHEQEFIAIQTEVLTQAGFFPANQEPCIIDSFPEGWSDKCQPCESRPDKKIARPVTTPFHMTTTELYAPGFGFLTLSRMPWRDWGAAIDWCRTKDVYSVLSTSAVVSDFLTTSPSSPSVPLGPTRPGRPYTEEEHEPIIPKGNTISQLRNHLKNLTLTGGPGSPLDPGGPRSPCWIGVKKASDSSSLRFDGLTRVKWMMSDFMYRGWRVTVPKSMITKILNH